MLVLVLGSLPFHIPREVGIKILVDDTVSDLYNGSSTSGSEIVWHWNTPNGFGFDLISTYTEHAKMSQM